MGELLAEWPSASLTLFARYGVGSRDKLGFRAEQPLRAVLARYLIFEPEKVMETLREAEEQQRRYRVSPQEFAAGCGSGRVVDCRSREEWETVHLPGAQYLDAELAAAIRAEPDTPLWLYDHRGPLAGAAALHFAGLGCRCVRVLDGGLLAWSEQVDPTFPAYGAESSDAPVRLLPDRRQARFRVGERAPAPLEASPEQVPFACARVWWQDDFVAVLRESSQNWHEVAPTVLGWLSGPWRQYFTRPLRLEEQSTRAMLREVLREQVQPTLTSHKGEVELVDFNQGVAHVALSGGCQGCSSAAITVSEEIAAYLYRALPELLGVEDASWHEDPAATPHH